MTTNKATTRQKIVGLLLVLTMLTILAGLVIPHRDNGGVARTVAAQTDVAAFVTGLNQFKVDNGHYPKTNDGLEALIVSPHDATNNWKGPYLDEDVVPLDPWGQPYVYAFAGVHNPTFFDVYSKGKNGLGGKEAIGNWVD